MANLNKDDLGGKNNEPEVVNTFICPIVISSIYVVHKHGHMKQKRLVASLSSLCQMVVEIH